MVNYQDSKYDSDFYCSIFVDYDGNCKDIFDILSKKNKLRFLKREDGGYKTNTAEISAISNSYYNPEIDKTGKKDEFLNYKNKLEIDMYRSADHALFISEISDILLSLWEEGINAVASCNFEDKLPKNRKPNL